MCKGWKQKAKDLAEAVLIVVMEIAVTAWIVAAVFYGLVHGGTGLS